MDPVNTDTKWERVDFLALTPGDKVRVKHDSGDTFHGTIKPGIHSDRTIVLDNLLLPGLSMDAVQGRGYSVERAVPERTLPTEPGVYRCLSVPLDKFGSIYTLNTGSRWSDDRARDISEQSVPDDLVRLVPVTEAEEAEKRGRNAGIREIHGLLDRNPGGTYSAAVVIAKAYPEEVRDV